MCSKARVQYPSYCTKLYRHDLLFNFSEDNLFEGIEETCQQVNVEFPYPIHKPFKTTEVDPVNELLIEKEEYLNLLKTKRRRYGIDKKNITKEKISQKEYMYLPKHLLEFYKHKDPDSYFNCDYNFYYTGGFLEHIKINNEDYLIRPDAQNRLCLSNLQLPQHSTVLNYDMPTTIFNIRAVSSSNGHLLVLRGKHDVNIATLSNTHELSEVWTHKHRVPLLDVRLNHEALSTVAILDVNHKLSIRDVETGHTLVSYNDENVSKIDNFQQFQFISKDTVALSDRYRVKFIDWRTKDIEQQFNLDLEECNYLCDFKISGNNFYLSSRHYLIKSDLRNLEKASCYSHLMDCPPCYMSLRSKENDTFLCLAGQVQKNKVLFTGNSTFALPFGVPDIQRTLRKCLLSNPSMILHSNLQNRLNFSVAGLKVIDLHNEMFIFWSNSLGEIFKQKISLEEPDAEHPVETLRDWVNCLKKIKPVLHLTHVEDASHARFSLNSNPIEHNLTKYRKYDTAQNFLEKFTPVYSKKNVTSKLAQDFLAVWDSDDSDDDQEKTETLPEVPLEDKVNTWIQSHDFSDDENSFSFLNISQELATK